MPARFWFAIVCLATCEAALAQAPATPGASGTGAAIQVGPNGTLDVGGARAADLDFTGGNLLGRFGASRPQAPAAASPLSSPVPAAAPRIGYPGFGPPLGLGGSPLGTVGDLASPDRTSQEPRSLDGPRGSAARLDALRDLILPRFRWSTGSVPPPRPATLPAAGAPATKDDKAF